jgi:thiamine biosynthesis lipoprotein
MKVLFFFSYCLFLQSYYAQSELIQLEGEAQGTYYHISYYDNQNRDLQFQIDSILRDFDQSVSTYQPNSIISRINRNEKNVTLDNYFITCFNKAKEVWKNTGGAFDPTVYPLVNAWGFGPGKKVKIEQHEIDSILSFVGFEKINLKHGHTLVKKDPRVTLDFNAFAQGYSVDVVSAYLQLNGIKSFIVEIGGEVYAQGVQPNGENWTVGIEEPYDNKLSGNTYYAIAKLENRAIATSGNYRRFIIEDGIKYAHHIDPKTGYPTKNNLLSASIFANECITSDATATGILVMGLDAAITYLDKHPEIQAYLIYSDEHGDYQVYKTSGIADIMIDEK